MKFKPDPSTMKLKPCPFCGTTAEAHYGYGGDYDDEWVIECVGDNDCFVSLSASWSIRGSKEDDILKSKYEAILVWNRRVNNK